MNEAQVQAKNAQLKAKQPEDVKPLVDSPLQINLPQGTCTACGRGWTLPALTDGVCIDCQRQRRDGVSQEVRVKRWQSVAVPRYAGARLKDLESHVQQAWDDLGEDRGMFLWGPVGGGKTHAMMAIAYDIIFTQGRRILRTTYKRMYASITGTYGRTLVTELEQIDRYSKAEVLIIEDISILRQETDNSLVVFMAIIDYRYEHMLPTFMTSNYEANNLGDAFDERVLSRLKQMCEIIQVTHADRRVKG